MSSQYIDYHCLEKDNNNGIIVTLAKKHLKSIGYILTLDGTECGSSRTFIGMGIATPQQILVPQKDYDQYLRIAKQGICQPYYGTMENFLNELEKHNSQMFNSINVCYFDYMGMVTGNDKTKPLEDIWFLLSRTTQSRLVLATTFCLRSQGKYDGRETMDEQILKDFIQPIIKYTQWKIIEQYNRHYNRSLIDDGQIKKGQTMFFSAFALEKDTSIDPTKVKFVIDDNGKWVGYH